MSDLRTELYARLEGIRVTTYRDGEPSGLMPESHARIVNLMVDAVVDLAGRGELLASIDRLYRSDVCDVSGSKPGLAG